MISITKKNLPNIEKVIKKIKFGNSSIGAIFTFIGFVRDFQFNEIDHLDHLFIEHYEGMTQFVYHSYVNLQELQVENARGKEGV